MIIEAGTIREWDGLCALVREQFKNGWIYRGVRDSGYGLRPGIGRKGARKDSHGRELPHSIDEEKRLLKQFKREARKLFQWQLATELEWMILGQHHRLPTRLLDWTQSLFVAAFFAAEDPLQGREAAIYAVEPPPEIEDLSANPFDPQLCDSPRLVRPPHITERITAQRGVLTLHPCPDTDWEADGIHRWRIAESFTFTLKGLLDFSGIHAASMFPDSVDRHTEHLGWLYKRSRLA